ncbi:MAG: DUF1127 domain-containing protein [Roseovarius sp.]
MTFMTQTRTAPSGLALEISAMMHHAMQAAMDYYLYRVTLRELRALDTAALTDLGLHRSGIRAAARKAVYGI